MNMKSLNVDETVLCKCSAVDGDPARGHAFPLTSTFLSLRTWGEKTSPAWLSFEPRSIEIKENMILMRKHKHGKHNPAVKKSLCISFGSVKYTLRCSILLWH